MRWLLSIGLWLFPTVVCAQLSPFREHVRNMDSGRLGAALSTSFSSAEPDSIPSVLVSPSMLLDYRLGEVVFESALGLAYVHQTLDTGERQHKLASGNPWLGLAYLPDCSCGLSRLSAGVAFPLASDGTPLGRTALALARLSRGDWDGYLWNGEVLPLVLGASTLMGQGLFRLAWDGDVVVGLPVGTRDAEVGMQNAIDLGVASDAASFQFGLRLSGVYFPTFHEDVFQAALSAYTRISVGSLLLGASYLVNLDRFAGVGPGPASSWGAQALLGSTF